MTPANKGRRYRTDPLTQEEILSLLAQCNTRFRTGMRNRALIAVLWRCGLRVSECCDLKLEDIRFGEPCSLRVLKPKGWGQSKPKPPRELGIDFKLCALIHQWVDRRGIEPGPLFSTWSGKRLDPAYLRLTIPKLAVKAGIRRRVHAHALRHSFARNLYDEGIGMVHIMGALGHSSLNTTAVYLQSIGASEVVATTARREW